MTDGHVSHLPEPEYIDDHYRGSGKLEGKRVLISGGDSGIGRAVALHMAREGAKVAILYRSAEEKAAETRAGIEAEGAQALVIRADMASTADCDNAVAQTVAAWGAIDVLVNNAGFQKPSAKLEEVGDAEWQAHFDVNMAGMFRLTRAAIAHMAPGSAIVNTTSINAFAGHAALLPYSATKGAISAFTRALAKQVMERGIRVNEVAPGPVATDIQNVFEDFDDDILKNMAAPIGRVGQPREIAPAYVYLACRDAAFVTGQTIHVNGGMILGS
ncbi:SDR family oxidoreductase [Mangrovicoccus algicola]|uniref:SDR family oxidoreductase n=1 Tax=Mangrovicoccus algicola TaxID=2771008 RepID=A0A8J6YVW5_9RHOB|nr:SDR family oxidoreductase [Mangrovicoccus algicola]MBE3638830.1 SDR family oxidoreductase [Mangrovicoccus algicola]